MHLPIIINNTTNLSKEYTGMLTKIEDNMPAILEAQQAFYKTQSQFMDNMLTVTHPTPIRNIRQILAEINKSKTALDQAYLKIKKKNIYINRKKIQLDNTNDLLEKELINLQIQEAHLFIETTENYMKGAIRKISAYIEQYNALLKYIGKNEITEQDFEKEESRYHIGKAFEQALIAARSRGGIIDEGNFIYFQQIGINGAVAQYEITNYLNMEKAIIEDNKLPTHKMTLNWLNALMDEYEDYPRIFAETKGMTLGDLQSMLD